MLFIFDDELIFPIFFGNDILSSNEAIQKLSFLRPTGTDLGPTVVFGRLLSISSAF